ncbi:DUF1772 domain-containing protein [Mycolicibacterium sp. HK-90]|uniref:DUF1772 domain-containing protein n=1 Tax=Mycolicibacterium sp. HK-90 TaxID=3056937 RepID=UPI0026595A6F|nr:DUF1772 domain-containing protein [Mycolicibacterium sp. HK-90]WKG03520.1 DUF1772 domain-containing protein [Mycolicibacterium sp. HK-90]
MTPLSVIALCLVAITFGLSLAHALEYPGKARLDEPTYRSVQAIYYPGFTIGGLVGEVGSLISVALLLAFTPMDSPRFGWTAAALGFMVLVHLTYWFVTHPVNHAWMEGTEVSTTGRKFFATHSAGESDWRHMRDRWELSHVARAVLAALSFVALTVAAV